MSNPEDTAALLIGRLHLMLRRTVRERDEARAEVERLRGELDEARKVCLARAEVPVHLTDIEALAKELALTSEHHQHIVNTAARFTKPIDREELRSAFLTAHSNWRPSDHDREPSDGGPIGRGVDAVLRHLGAQAAQPVEPAKCSRCGGSGWVWRHELDTPMDPSDPSPDDTRYLCPDCQRGGPKPPEPAKVRVKLPPKCNYNPNNRPVTTTNWRAGFDAGIDACAASLRSQGVEVDDAP